MAAISKPWITLTDAATDADSVVDQALVQGLRDDLVHLREWLGAAYVGAAEQNHNHDGVNSALVEVGSNVLRNGSFEDGITGWTITQYSGGTVVTNIANDMDGATALAFTSTVLANGGGLALSNEFRTCTGNELIFVKAAVKASVANVSSRVRVVWFDEGKAQISTSTIHSSTATPTVASIVANMVAAPAAARFYKVELVGGVPASGAAVGVVYFDGVYSSPIPISPQGSGSVATTSGASQAVTGIPPGVNEFFAHVVGSQTSGTSNMLLQLGDSGGLENSGYTYDVNAAANGVTLSVSPGASDPVYAFIHGRRLPGTNTWHMRGWRGWAGGNVTLAGAIKTLTGDLDRVGVAPSGGSLNGGSMTVVWKA